MERSSGVLMPIFSLPSPHGIGSLGKAAYEFADFLAQAGQTWWQILPLGPVAFGNSPYQSLSAYAGNPLLIDLDMLIEEGLLSKKEVSAVDWGKEPEVVDYDLQREKRAPLIAAAAERCLETNGDKVRAFAGENAAWLDDYALFIAVREHFGDRSWQEWPDEEIRLRNAEAVKRYKEELGGEIQRITAEQYLFFSQWDRLREYAHSKGLRILGDMALYVAPDSADVWASPESFLLDEKNVPTDVAGVPPDYFSKDGQLWGNPLYNYEEMKKSGYGWWIRRIGGAERLYDAIRIDHFRGLASFWAVPAGETTARNGRWMQGPGMDLLQILKNWFPQICFIAEDLGICTPDVEQLLADCGFPGMRVLEFAFSVEEESTYLPHRLVRNCVCYVGTHDNDTAKGWLTGAPKAEVEKARKYLGLSKSEGEVWGLLRGGSSSVADLFIAQMQDLLELGSSARMNTPGTVGGNWCWRMLPGKATGELAKKFREMTEIYGRLTAAREKGNSDAGISEKS